MNDPRSRVELPGKPGQVKQNQIDPFQNPQLFEFTEKDGVLEVRPRAGVKFVGLSPDPVVYDPFPLGLVLGWHKNFAAALTVGPEWAECNGQVLNDPASPFNGLTLPNLNHANGRFLRGTNGTTGAMQNDDWRDIHLNNWNQGSSGYAHSGWMGKALKSKSTGAETGSPTTMYFTGSWGTPATANHLRYDADGEFRPTNMSVLWLMKVRIVRFVREVS